ncbi:MAG: DUF1810 domain-containing protein [Bdellovibrionales bacterium]|nr:DUF1810 domain-containing protein [Massilia sp.]
MDNLEKFVAAQAPLYESVLAELRAGRKRTHWMWFVFPQIAGLGRSATARHYALASLAEAKAYLAHALLGERLRQCCALVLAVEGRSAHEVFGDPDELKFRSCLTLFASAAPGEAVFAQCLEKYFGGLPDAGTLALIA